MPIPVKIFTWAPGGGAMAINELDALMFDAPAVGSGYWIHNEPLFVREVDAGSDPVRVDLEHDSAWEHEVRAALPDGYWLNGGRSDVDGSWHFQIMKDGVECPTPPFSGATLEQAIGEATAAAHAHAQQSG